MISCLIIDDEPLARTLLIEYLQDFPEIKVLQECGDGFAGVKAIAQHQPDLIFLDIQMPKINGFEMLELIENPPAVIFTTAFDTYAIKAFEANAIDYLLKPFSKDRFAKAIGKLVAQINNKVPSPSVQNLGESYSIGGENQQRIVVKHGSDIRIIPLIEITYLEAYGDYIKIHCKEGVFLKKQTMNFYENKLDPGKFIRVHRSYMVQSNQIHKIEAADFVRLKSGEKVPVSKTGYTKLKVGLGLQD